MSGYRVIEVDTGESFIAETGILKNKVSALLADGVIPVLRTVSSKKWNEWIFRFSFHNGLPVTDDNIQTTDGDLL